MRRILLTHSFYILGLLVLSILIVIPYFKSGYFPTHDGEWAVVRLGDMFRTLRDFQFPPRYSGALNFGYGYPLFNFAYPFPYYLGILIYIPLQSFILSIKSIFILSVFLSALFMYIASSAFWKDRLAGFVSAVIYIYLPYRMVDLYVRGSIGESLSFVLFPIIFYFSIKLFDSPFSRIIVVLLTILIGILVLTHNIMTILFLPLLFVFIITKIIKEKRFDVLQSFLLCIGIAAGLSAFFWIPAIFEKGNIALSQIPIADRSLYFVNFRDLIIPSWGYAPPTEEGGFSYQLGVAQIAIIVLTIIILVTSFIKNRFMLTPAKNTAFVLLILYVLYFVMMFSFTSIIWENVPLLSEINYPWTILSQLGLLTAILIGFVVVQGGLYKYLALLISVAAIFFTIGYAKPESYNNYPNEYYMTNEATTTSSDEYLPIWVKDKPESRFEEKVEVIEGEAVISNLSYDSKRIAFTYEATSNPTFKINTIYYPGWRAYLNAVETEIDYDNPQGVMIVKGDTYGNKVYLQFYENLLRTFANGITITAFLLLLFILLRPILLFKK